MSLLKSTGAGMLFCLLLAGLPNGAAAYQDPFRSAPLADNNTSQLWLADVSLETAIKKAKAKYGGKVLSAKEIRSKGPLVYKLKLLLPNGRVKTVFVDGKSGDVFEA